VLPAAGMAARALLAGAGGFAGLCRFIGGDAAHDLLRQRRWLRRRFQPHYRGADNFEHAQFLAAGGATYQMPLEGGQGA